LDAQLTAATSAFLNDPEKNYLEGNKLYVSKIFKWFKKDFTDGVVSFFIQFSGEELKGKLVENREKIKVKHLDYDWSLNGK
jgi:hypothetical protein